jgi:hypothetical protein
MQKSYGRLSAARALRLDTLPELMARLGLNAQGA